MGLAYIAFNQIALRQDIGYEGPMQGHWDGDVWVEPERRYDLAKMRELLHIPAEWQPPRNMPMPSVWIDYTQASVCFALESAEFPDPIPGRRLPQIWPVFRYEWDERAERGIVTFDHLDMREVEADKARQEASSITYMRLGDHASPAQAADEIAKFVNG